MLMNADFADAIKEDLRFSAFICVPMYLGNKRFDSQCL